MQAFKTALVVIAFLLFLVGVQSTSYAAPTNMELILFDGATTQIVFDGGVGDLNAANGAVTFGGAIGNWTINVTTGLTYPVLGSPSAPQLDLNSVNATSSAGGTLKILVSATDFLSAPGGAVLNIGGTTTAGTVVTKAFFDAANVLPAAFPPGGTQIGSALIFNTPAFSGSASGSSSGSAPYALTIETDIKHAAGGASSFDVSLVVPEPGTLILLGLGLVTFGIARKKIV